MENLTRFGTLDNEIIGLLFGRVLKNSDGTKDVGSKGFHLQDPFWLVVICNPHPYNNSIVGDADTSRESWGFFENCCKLLVCKEL